MNWLFKYRMRKLFRNDAPAPDKARLDMMAQRLGLAPQREQAPEPAPFSPRLGWAIAAVAAVAVIGLFTAEITIPKDNNDLGTAKTVAVNAANMQHDGQTPDSDDTLFAVMDDSDVEDIIFNLPPSGVAQVVDGWREVMERD